MPLRMLTPGIDANIRYLPLRRLECLSYRPLLEVGSRSEGIARYVEHLIVGADAHFPTSPIANLQTVMRTVAALYNLNTCKLESALAQYAYFFADRQFTLFRLLRRQLFIVEIEPP